MASSWQDNHGLNLQDFQNESMHNSKPLQKEGQKHFKSVSMFASDVTFDGIYNFFEARWRFINFW